MAVSMLRLWFCLLVAEAEGFAASGSLRLMPRRHATPLTRRRGSAEEENEAIADLLARAAALREAGEAGVEAAEEAVEESPEAILARRRAEAEALAAELSGEDVGDKVSGEAGVRGVPRTDRPARSDASRWPKFKGDAAARAPAFGGAFRGPAPREPLTEEKMRDPDLQATVRRQMINAFDNYPPSEVETMYDRLWAQGPKKFVRKLVEAVLDASDVEEAYEKGLLSDEAAGDEIRVARSRIRMYGKDAEFLPNPDGSPASDMWGSLDDWIPWRWKPDGP